MDQNNHFKIVIDGKEHDLYINNANLQALGAGAVIEMNGGEFYSAKIVAFMGSTETQYFMDQPPKLELIKLNFIKKGN